MTMYTDDTILLSQSSTERLLATLLNDNENLLLRDEFISDIQQHIIFKDDGSIVVDVPTIKMVERESYESQKNVVTTKHMSICAKYASEVNRCYQSTSLHNYNENEKNKKTKYSVKKFEPQYTWQTNTDQLGKVS